MLKFWKRLMKGERYTPGVQGAWIPMGTKSTYVDWMYLTALEGAAQAFIHEPDTPCLSSASEPVSALQLGAMGGALQTLTLRCSHCQKGMTIANHNLRRLDSISGRWTGVHAAYGEPPVAG